MSRVLRISRKRRSSRKLAPGKRRCRVLRPPEPLEARQLLAADYFSVAPSNSADQLDETDLIADFAGLHADDLQDLHFAPLQESGPLPHATSTSLERAVSFEYTVGILPDGTPIKGVMGESDSPSSLVAALNNWLGSPDVWRPILERAMNSWGDVTGVRFTFVEYDDGAPQYFSQAVVGERADFRLGAHPFDGKGGILAVAAFSPSRDITIDTADISVSGDVSELERTLFSILVHEFGHGLDLGHVFTDTPSFVMEPYLNVALPGPQSDDIRVAHSIYRDGDEPNNDTDSATILELVDGKVEVETVSIHPGDHDVYRISVEAGKQLTVRLVPEGYTYLRGTTPENLQEFNSAAQNDLSLWVHDGVGEISARANGNPIGQTEAIKDLRLAADGGDVFLHVYGSEDATQLYRVEVEVSHADPLPAGDVSGLRDQIEAANASGVPTEIRVPAGEYDLGEEFVITGDVTLIGTGIGETVITAAGNSRHFYVLPEGSLALQGMTLRGGLADIGGSIRNESGNVSLKELLIRNSLAERDGGSLHLSGGTTQIEEVRIVASSSDGGGGGIYAINGEVTIQGCIIQNNSAAYGGGIVHHSGNMTISDTRIERNGASGNSGGILHEGGGRLVLRHSTVAGNSAAYGAGLDAGRGSITVVGSTIADNDARWSGGGVRLSDSGDMEIIDSIVENNEAYGGAGIDQGYGSRLSVQNTSIRWNESEQAGGGISTQGELWMDASTVYDNVAFRWFAGGILVSDTGVAQLSNTTISGNWANNTSAGVTSFAGGEIEIIHSTITDNALEVNNTGSGVGVHNHEAGAIRLTNTIVAGNLASDGAADVHGEIISSHSLIGNSGLATGFVDGENGNLSGTEFSPQVVWLTPLQDFGGPTLVHALLPGSPGIDAGVVVESVTVDQRGTSRRLNTPDIGAFEYIASPSAETSVRGDPGAWVPQPYPGSDGLSGLNVTTIAEDESVLRAWAELFRNGPRDEDPHRDGEMFVDLRNESSFPTHDLTNTRITAKIRLGRGLLGDAGPPAALNGTQIFLKSLKNEVWANYYGPWYNATSDWQTIELDLSQALQVAGPDDFDPNEATLLGIKVGTNSNVTGAFEDFVDVAFVRIDYANGEVYEWTFEPTESANQPPTPPGSEPASPEELFDLAAQIAAANASGEPAVIPVPAGTYPVTSEFLISGNVTIVGEGAGETTLVAEGDTRIFEVLGSLDLQGVTLQNGKSAEDGGAMLVLGTASLKQVTFENNEARSGGAIAVEAGAQLTMEEARISGNTALVYPGGGGILNRGETTITTSVIEGNVVSWGNGGGIANDLSGTLSVDRTTIAANEAENYGGGMISHAAGRTTITNSTISGNTSARQGSAIFANGEVSIIGSTITRNNSTSDLYGAGAVTVNTGIPFLQNNIIAENISALGAPDVLGRFDSGGGNLVGMISVASTDDGTGKRNPGSASGFGSLDQVGSEASPIAPRLTSLGLHGGLTPTHALQPPSPAIGAAVPYESLTIDQHGNPRGSDIGAAEFLPTHLFVTDADGLRLAVEAANASAEEVEIHLAAGTYDLDSELVVTGHVTLTGEAANQTDIDGGKRTRLFNVQPDATLSLAGLTLRNGQADFGGAIRNQGGLLNLTDVDLVDNHANQSGGALYLKNSTADLLRASMRDNTAVLSGAAVFAEGGTWNTRSGRWNELLNIVESDFRRNVAGEHGGAIHADNVVLQINEVAFLDNRAARWGGAISNHAMLIVRDAHFTSNTADLGGAIHNKWSNDAVIDQSVFSKNLARYGGGIFNWSNDAAPWESGPGTKLSVASSTFYQNHATERGGAIVNDNGILLVHSVWLRENLSDGDGGGLWHANATTEIRDSLIHDNQATGDGGGLYFSQYDVRGSATLSNVTVERNEAREGAGGGIFHHRASGITITATNLTARDNLAAFGNPDINGVVETLEPVADSPANDPETGLGFSVDVVMGTGGTEIPRSNGVGDSARHLYAGEQLIVPFFVDKAGWYEGVDIRFSNDDSSREFETGEVAIDGAIVGSVVFTDTGSRGGGHDWIEFEEVRLVINRELTPGWHTLEVTISGGDGYGVEIDAISGVPREAAALVSTEEVTALNEVPDLPMDAVQIAAHAIVGHDVALTFEALFASPADVGDAHAHGSHAHTHVSHADAHVSHEMALADEDSVPPSAAAASGDSGMDGAMTTDAATPDAKRRELSEFTESTSTRVDVGLPPADENFGEPFLRFASVGDGEGAIQSAPSSDEGDDQELDPPADALDEPGQSSRPVVGVPDSTESGTAHVAAEDDIAVPVERFGDDHAAVTAESFTLLVGERLVAEAEAGIGGVTMQRLHASGQMTKRLGPDEDLEVPYYAETDGGFDKLFVHFSMGSLDSKVGGEILVDGEYVGNVLFSEAHHADPASDQDEFDFVELKTDVEISAGWHRIKILITGTDSVEIDAIYGRWQEIVDVGPIWPTETGPSSVSAEASPGAVRIVVQNRSSGQLPVPELTTSTPVDDVSPESVAWTAGHTSFAEAPIIATGVVPNATASSPANLMPLGVTADTPVARQSLLPSPSITGPRAAAPEQLTALELPASQNTSNSRSSLTTTLIDSSPAPNAIEPKISDKPAVSGPVADFAQKSPLPAAMTARAANAVKPTISDSPSAPGPLAESARDDSLPSVITADATSAIGPGVSPSPSASWPVSESAENDSLPSTMTTAAASTIEPQISDGATASRPLSDSAPDDSLPSTVTARPTDAIKPERPDGRSASRHSWDSLHTDSTRIAPTAVEPDATAHEPSAAMPNTTEITASTQTTPASMGKSTTTLSEMSVRARNRHQPTVFVSADSTWNETAATEPTTKVSKPAHWTPTTSDSLPSSSSNAGSAALTGTRMDTAPTADEFPVPSVTVVVSMDTTQRDSTRSLPEAKRLVEARNSCSHSLPRATVDWQEADDDLSHSALTPTLIGTISLVAFHVAVAFRSARRRGAVADEFFASGQSAQPPLVDRSAANAAGHDPGADIAFDSVLDEIASDCAVRRRFEPSHVEPSTDQDPVSQTAHLPCKPRAPHGRRNRSKR